MFCNLFGTNGFTRWSMNKQILFYGRAAFLDSLLEYSRPKGLGINPI